MFEKLPITQLECFGSEPMDQRVELSLTSPEVSVCIEALRKPQSRI